MPDLDRRDFLKLVGAGAGAAASAACSDPVENLIPYVVQPEDVTPGIPVVYASTCRECPVACGLHVTTREGRPIKLEGNPEHPINRGKLCARGQAGIGRTYHPDRHEGPSARDAAGDVAPISWDDGISKLGDALRAARGKVAVLGASRGPAIDGVIDAFVAGADARRVVYQPFGNEALRAATEVVFGVAALPIVDVSDADLVLDFGSDFLDSWISPTEHSAQFADAQDIGKRADGGARLVAISPRMNLTASNADQWIPAAPGSEGALALALARAVHGAARVSVEAGIESALAKADIAAAVAAAGIERSEFDALVQRLASAKAAVALPPGVAATGTRAVAANAAVLVLDAVLGAIGSRVVVPSTPDARPAAGLAEIEALVADMRAGRIDVLLVHDANPVYSLPASLGFTDALEQVKLVVAFAPLADETSERAGLSLPDHTPLESWGDAAPRAGVRSLVQPTIRPLWDTRAIGDTLLAAGRAAGFDGLPDGDTRSLVEAAWSGSNFRAALSRGGEFSAAPSGAPAAVGGAAGLNYAPAAIEGKGDLTLVAYPHSMLADGSGAALPWLQEIPDPVMKLAWWSWAEVSKATGKKLGVVFGDVISIETAAGRIEVPVYPRGGIRDDVVAVPIGQGHSVGHYASLAGDGQPGEARGVSVISVLPSAKDERGGRAWLAAKASVAKTGAFRRVALSQWTDNQRGRGLAQEVSLLALAEGGHAEEHDPNHHVVAFEPSQDASPDSEYRWGMTIDADRCNGCSACIAACYIENNVPVVGEDGAMRHREMNWIRIERYVGDGDTDGGEARRPYPDREELGEVNVRHAPMLCQHCGAAPCESVCPVIATYHTPDGLNGMVYNRCVGTRYCANNCTYKVRRFNYFDYGNDNFPGTLGLMLNPDVTVRQQGVMEKCTFCVQRIQAARQPAKDAGRPVADGEVLTACQQSCPTSAITFGNTRDPQSAVSQKADQPARAYHSLHVLNTRPAITYLAQVKREGDERSHG